LRQSALLFALDRFRGTAAYGHQQQLLKGASMQKKNRQKGVTVVEYAIMLALIAIAVAVAAPNITSAVVGVFDKASSVMNK
jgi:Flp pilus assembly pilin Flp